MLAVAVTGPQAPGARRTGAWLGVYAIAALDAHPRELFCAMKGPPGVREAGSGVAHGRLRRRWVGRDIGVR